MVAIWGGSFVGRNEAEQARSMGKTVQQIEGDPTRHEWHTEREIDPGLVLATEDRKVRTPAELETIMQEPIHPTPTRFVWIHESLVDEVRQLWEQMAAGLE